MALVFTFKQITQLGPTESFKTLLNPFWPAYLKNTSASPLLNLASQFFKRKHQKHPSLLSYSTPLQSRLPIQLNALASVSIPVTRGFHTSRNSKQKSLRALNVLKYLPHSSFWCNRKILVPLYCALIRSILDHESPIYGLTPSSQLALLHSVRNVAICICTGAFRTCPTLSSCAESGYPHYTTATIPNPPYLHCSTSWYLCPRHSLQLSSSPPNLPKIIHAHALLP